MRSRMWRTNVKFKIGFLIQISTHFLKLFFNKNTYKQNKKL
jgi:hypothetical protein